MNEYVIIDGVRYAAIALTGATGSSGNPAGNVVVDGLSASHVRVVAGATYNTTDILAVTVLLKGTGTLTLSPKSGDTDIVITAAELTEFANTMRTFYGRFDSVTAGAGMELLAYID